MKKITSFPLYISLLVLSAVAITACEKNELNLNKNTVLSDGAFFKLGWFSPAISTQGVQLKVNNERVSYLLGLGHTSTTTYAMPFPGGGLNTGGNNKNDYLSIPAGSPEVSLTIPKKGTNEDSVTVLKTNVTLQQGKYYTWIVTDSFPNAQHYMLEDTATLADSGFIKLNFTNAIPNIPAQAGIDFLITNSAGTNVVVATKVPFKGATGFIPIKYVTGTYTFSIRTNGTTAVLGTAYATSGLTNKRGYTVVARGYVGGTGTRVPTLSLIFNR
jgi:hypothetical protein